MVWVANNLAIDLDTFLYEEKAHVLAAELGQVTQKTVYTHGVNHMKYRRLSYVSCFASAEGNVPWAFAQFGQRHARFRHSGGSASRALGSMCTLKHQQGVSWEAALAIEQLLRAPHAGQQSGGVISKCP